MKPVSTRVNSCSVRIISPAPVEQHQRQRGLDHHQPAAQPVRARGEAGRRGRERARAGRRRRTPGTPAARRRRCRRARRRRARTAAPGRRGARRRCAACLRAPTATSARSSHAATTTPSAPPATEMSVLSTSSWLASRARPPPSAARTASSCCRAAPRATSRFATLTHAISSRKPTAPNSASSVSRTSSTRRSASRSARTLIAAVGVRIFALERGGNRPQLAGGALDRDARPSDVRAHRTRCGCRDRAARRCPTRDPSTVKTS